MYTIDDPKTQRPSAPRTESSQRKRMLSSAAQLLLRRGFKVKAPVVQGQKRKSVTAPPQKDVPALVGDRQDFLRPWDMSIAELEAYHRDQERALREAFLLEQAAVPIAQAPCGEAQARRWIAEGRMFVIEREGQEWLPLFQLRNDQPHPVVVEALAHLQPVLQGWDLALWFTLPCGWLPDDAAPVSLLDQDGAAVVDAAHHEGTEQYY